MTPYKEILTKGIIKHWGFGRNRIKVTSPTNYAQCPYSFIGLGYKNKEGKLFIGLRMNVDQYIPLKLREWTDDLNVEVAWWYMMLECIEDLQLLKKTFKKS
jgi:hypothetical protein